MKHLLIFLCCIFFSCANNNEVIDTGFDEDLFLEFAQLKLEGVEVAMIIPQTGCKDCISEIQSFIVEHVQDKKLLVVFSRIIDRKLLLNRLGFTSASVPKQIIFDRKGVLNSLNKKYIIYPAVVFLEDKKIIQVKYKTPETPHLLEEVEAFLKK